MVAAMHQTVNTVVGFAASWITLETVIALCLRQHTPLEHCRTRYGIYGRAKATVGLF